MSIYFVDVAAEMLETIVPRGTIPLNPSEIAISPDGKYAMVSGGISPWMGLISLEERKYVDIFRPDTIYSAVPFGVACRAWPY
jgi:hypothetical protein